MSYVVGFVIGLPLIGAMVWLGYYFWNSDRVLDSRISNGDLTILNSSNFKINEVVRAPSGSRIEKVAQQIIPQIEGGYVRQKLPDGRIALIPANSIRSEFKDPVSQIDKQNPPPL